MKKRHKWIAALSAVALFAVLAVGIAFAAGRLTRPREDVVVAAGGGAATATPRIEQKTPLRPAPTATPTPSVSVESTATPMPTPEPTPTPMPPSSTDYSIVFTLKNAAYYHADPNCSGMEDAIAWTEESAVAMGKQPCPVCVIRAEASDLTGLASQAPETTVYCSERGAYYHGDPLCSGMLNAQALPLAEAEAAGKGRCPVCQPVRPDHYDLFVKAFGRGLEALYPGYAYAFTGGNTLENDRNAWYVTDGREEFRACVAMSFLKQDGGNEIAQEDWGAFEDVMCFTLTADANNDLWAFLSEAPQPQRDGIFSETAEDAAYKALADAGIAECPVSLKQVWVAVDPRGRIQAARLTFADGVHAVRAEVFFEWKEDYRVAWKAQ